MPLHQIETQSEVKPLKVGYSRRDDDDSCSYIFAVYDKAAAEAEVGWVADTGNTEFAERLTGWCRSYNGPGRSFSHEPTLKVYGKKIIVIQTRGQDI